MREFDPRLKLAAARKWSIPFLFRRSTRPNASTSFRFLARRIGNDLPPDSGRVITLSSLVRPESASGALAMLGWYLHDELAREVLLVDGGFRQAHASRYFEHDHAVGLSDVLRADAELNEAVVPLTNGISLLPAGTDVARAGEQFDPSALARLLQEARSHWSYVLVQHGPLAADTRFITWGRLSELVLVVAEDGGTRLSELEAVNEIYHQNGIMQVQLLMTGSAARVKEAAEGE